MNAGKIKRSGSLWVWRRVGPLSGGLTRYFVGSDDGKPLASFSRYAKARIHSKEHGKQS